MQQCDVMPTKVLSCLSKPCPQSVMLSLSATGSGNVSLIDAREMDLAVLFGSLLIINATSLAKWDLQQVQEFRNAKA